MRLRLVILCLLLICFPGLLSAQLYKYYDKNNTLSFTDDLSMVPLDQRTEIETMYEIKTKPGVSIDPVKERGTKSISRKKIVDEAALKSELEQESKKLGAMKKDLDDKYIDLKDRREILILNGKRKLTSKETQEYNQKANDLNQDTLKYKEKKQAYFKKLEEYNLKLESVYE